MKNIKNYIFILGLISFIGCQDDEATLKDERVDKPVATLEQTSITTMEGDSAVFTIKLDKPTDIVSNFKVELENPSDKMMHYEYTVTDKNGEFVSFASEYGGPGYLISVPAFATSAEFVIVPKEDFKVSPQGRDFNFRLRPVLKMASLVNEKSTNFTVKVKDAERNAIGLQLSWNNQYLDNLGDLHNGTYVGADGKKHEYADFDFDMYVVSQDGTKVDGDQAATGNEPEVAILENSDLADGTYRIVTDLYASGAAPLNETTFPLTLKVIKFGTWNYTLPITAYKTTTAGNTSGENQVVVALLVKSGNTYTLKNPETDQVYASGKF